MDDRKELLKRILRGDLTPDMLIPTTWLYIAHTRYNGVIIAEDVFALKSPGIPSEIDRITPGKAERIVALHKKGIFGVPFIDRRDFIQTPQPWAPFGSTETTAYSGNHHPPTIHVAGIPAELLIIS